MHCLPAVAILLLCAFLPARAADLSVERMGVRGDFFQKGVWSGTDLPGGDLEDAKTVGANCIAISASPDPATDGQLRAGIRAAMAGGFQVLLVPEVPDADLSGMSAAGQTQWFASFFDSVLRLARVAAEEGVPFFAVGNGVPGASGAQFTDQWRRGIEQVRAVYPGLLTYGADAAEEFSNVGFWDALDVIGITYALPVQPENPSPVTSEILGLQARLAAFAQAAGKPVVFTALKLEPSSGDVPVSSGEAPGVARFLAKDFFEQIFAQPWLQGIYVRFPEEGVTADPVQIIIRDFFESGGR